MRIIKAILYLIMVCGAAGIAAADRTVSGVVVAADGSPLAYASVVVRERKTVTVTDRDGRFSFDLPEEGVYTLAASYAGFATAEVKVSMPDSSEIEISLEEDPMNISAVVITGTRTPKLLKDTPVQTRVITSEDIRKVDATNIGDLLRSELPAIEFSYSMNQQVSLDMQGFGGTSVLFLVDGERLAGETMDNIDYSRLNMDNVERIEIVKGAASSLYGSNAVGGVVNIITREALKPWAVNVNSRYGSHNAWRNGVSASVRQGRVNSFTSLQHTAQDSYPLGDEGDYTTLYGNKTFSVKERLGIRLSDRVELVAKGGWYFRERDYSKAIRNRYRDYSGGLKMNYDIDGWNYLEASYVFDQYDKGNYYPAKDEEIRNYRNIQNTVRALYNRTLGGGHTFTVGGDMALDDLMSYQFGDDDSFSQYTADVFFQADLKVAERVALVGGWRADYFSEIDKLQFTPKLAVMYSPGDFALRGSYSGGFRAPTLKEMHMDFDMAGVFTIYGNENLLPETSHNLMLSGEYTRHRWSVTSAAYYSNVKNRIGTVWNADLNGMQYINTGKMNVAGADAAMALKLPCGFGARLSYAFTKEIVELGKVSTSDTRPHSAVVRLEYGRRWKNYGFDVILSGRWMSSVDTNGVTTLAPPYEYTEIHYPGYTMWKLIVSQRFGRAFTLTAAADNLFNYKPDYFYANSPLPYGSEFMVGLSVNIEELFSGNGRGE